MMQQSTKNRLSGLLNREFPPVKPFLRGLNSSKNVGSPFTLLDGLFLIQGMRRSSARSLTGRAALFQSPDVQWVHCKGQEEGTEKSLPPRRRPNVIAKRSKERQNTIPQFKQQQPPDSSEKVLMKK